MFVKAEITAYIDREHTYNVDIQDSGLGVKRFAFKMPFYDGDAFHRVIAHLYRQWVKECNAPVMTVVPVVDTDRVLKIIEELENETEEVEAVFTDDGAGVDVPSVPDVDRGPGEPRESIPDDIIENEPQPE